MSEAGSNGADFLKIWTEFASKVSSTQSGLGEALSPDTVRQIRDAALDAMGKHYEALLRSPAFCESLAESTKLSIQARKQYNQFMTRLHHEAQSVALEDVDALLAAVRHMEDSIGARLARIEERLEALAKGSPAASAGKVQAAPSSPKQAERPTRPDRPAPARSKSPPSKTRRGGKRRKG